jgi:hypothetical protein
VLGKVWCILCALRSIAFVNEVCTQLQIKSQIRRWYCNQFCSQSPSQPLRERSIFLPTCILPFIFTLISHIRVPNTDPCNRSPHPVHQTSAVGTSFRHTTYEHGSVRHARHAYARYCTPTVCRRTGPHTRTVLCIMYSYADDDEWIARENCARPWLWFRQLVQRMYI